MPKSRPGATRATQGSLSACILSLVGDIFARWSETIGGPIDSPLPPKLALDNLTPSFSDQQKTESEILWPTKNNPSPFIYDPKAHPVTKKTPLLESWRATFNNTITKKPQTQVLHISTFGLFIRSNTKDVVVNVSIWLKFSNLQNLWSLSARILWHQ